MVALLATGAVANVVLLKSEKEVETPQQPDVFLEQQNVNQEQSEKVYRAVHVVPQGRAVHNATHNNGTHTATHNNHNTHGTHTTAQHGTSQSQTQAVGFHALLTSDFLTVPHPQTFVFDNLQLNMGHGYNAHNGHFRAPVAGLYCFTANIKFRSSDTAELNASIVKNGDEIGLLYVYGQDTVTRTTVVMLALGDFVWLKNNVNNSPRIYDGKYSTFSGFLITPVG